MDILHTIDTVRGMLKTLRSERETIALVPTMGNLHEGHLKLVETAGIAHSCVVVSIFVNPLQFGPDEDFDSYPRTLDEDCAQLKAAGARVVFAPSVAEMYPLGQQNHVEVKLPHLANLLCGEHRPGHFDGVGTVVTKLFNIIQPDAAFFGEKDYQQLQLIRIISEQLNLTTNVLGVPTVRATDGLALSSRNQYLNESERASAPLLHATITGIREKIAAGEQDYAGLQSDALAQLSKAGFVPDYVEVRDAQTLSAPTTSTKELRILAAARLGKARLIDNIGAETP